ncbi:efflux RND transporter periplasmic adaptor subunit [Erythrobacter sp. YT30]|uniref:efflux RND transporter periplasmic adaptor subunit n=1 Tax=Erythrobacter sp. YT30 TaxID=1735012 RepID=UPI00076D8691|nr:HlyD family efflux transporter periplasmic adaptor subunit [Erythrobacter sp. YT30]KWV91065.1 RND transporter [Erythrobacter sp. YT30]
MSTQVKWSLGILAAALAIAALMILLRPDPVEEERVQQAPLVEAIAFEAASGEIPVIASGTVGPREEVVIGAQVSGRLSYVNPSFREGGVVAAGATLFRIEAADFVNQVRIAQADVAAQNVSVLQAEEEVAIATDELRRFAQRDGAAGGLSSVIDTNDHAARILPPADMEESVTAPRAGSSEETKDIAGLATREPQLQSAKAARDRAAANLAVAELTLARTRVASPFRGLVREESAAVGTLVQPGQSLGSIVASDAFEVRLSLTQDEAALIPGLLRGSSGRIQADIFYDYSGLTYRWPAFVDRADAILDSATRNVEVFLQVPAPLTGGRLADQENVDTVAQAPPLLLGAFVRAEIAGTSLDSYAVIPAVALRPGNEIWVVRDGKMRILPVRVIQRTDDLAYVIAPRVELGGLLVTSSLTAPTDGMPVRVSGKQAQ